MSTSPLVIVPKYAKIGTGFSRREQAAALVHPGRRTDGTQSAASWVTALTDLRKTVLLCTYCRPKFNPRRARYRVFFAPDVTGKTSGYQVNGVCDGCKQHTALLPGGGTGYIAEDTYAALCLDPVEARRRARAAAGWTSVWTRVSRMIERWGSRAPREGAARS